MLAAAMRKYTDAGWSVVVCPKNAPMEFIAVKTDKMHFVRTSAPDFAGAYIQNAFSNMADPIVVSGEISAPVFTNINVQSRIMLRPMPKKAIVPKKGPVKS